LGNLFPSEIEKEGKGGDGSVRLLWDPGGKGGAGARNRAKGG